MKKILSFLIVFVFAFSCVTYAGGWFAGASDWAEEELSAAVENEIISYDDFLSIGGYSNKITREEFAMLVVRLYKAMTGITPEKASNDTFTDSTNIDVLMANKLGIINGKGAGIFAPNDRITRQEMAIIMKRTLDVIGIDYNAGDGVLTVGDKDSVDSWAVQGVDFAFENGFMKGDGINFSPLDNTPIEQAVMIVNRIFEEYKDILVKEPEVESDYTKGYILNIYDERLNMIYKNSQNTLMIEPYGVSKADFSETENSKFYYLKSGIVWRKDLESTSYPESISNKIRQYGLATDFVVAKGGAYDGYVAIKYRNNNNYFVFKNDADATSEGEISSVNDINYELGEMYASIENEKYQFTITVTDPSQNWENVKFNEDDMYFFSFPSHYDTIEDKEGYLRMSPTDDNDDAYCGPIGRVGSKSSQWTFNGFGGTYETDIKFFDDSGNAGIVFNLKYAGDGNDNFAGYYAGIDVENNVAILGKGSYGVWTKIAAKPIGYDISSQDTATLKVYKDGPNIQVYIDDVLLITASDDTYTENGGFGIRTFRCDVQYSNYTIEPLGF